MVTFTDIKVAVHNGFCSCGEPFNPRTGEACTETEQDKVERAVIVTLIERGALKYVTVNDEGNCRHPLSGCCWICGDVGDHVVGSWDSGVTQPCPTGYTRMEIIERLDGRGFRD